MNSKLKFKGKVITHLIFPLLLGGLTLIVGSVIAWHEGLPGFIIAFLSFVYIVVVLVMYFINKPIIMSELIKFAVNYAQVQKELLQDMALPYGLIDMSGSIFWSNYQMQMILDSIGKGKNIFNEVEGIPQDCVNLEEGEIKDTNVILNGRNYRIQFKRINTHNIFENSDILQMPENNDYLVAIYFFDETEIKTLIKQNFNYLLFFSQFSIITLK